ncbi:MAG: Xaa-Pro peptidase family protein [Actinomycetota bacterium]|jgi:Xaa-Pro aminopeptidase
MIPIDVKARADRVRAGFEGIDGLVVTDLTNLRWLTGFSGSNGLGVVLPDEIVIVTDGRYGDQAVQQMAVSGCSGRVEVGRTAAAITGVAARVVASLGRVGFESAHLSHQRFVELVAALQPELVATVGLVEAGRRTKDRAEIERIQQACAIADHALADVGPTIAPGCTEVEVRNALEQRMRELGAAGPSYETIVATGPVDAALPHHRPTPTPIEVGHTLVVDVGALVDGYHSDMTRSFVIGRPTALQQEVYEVVLAAQTAGVDAVRPGLDVRELDAVCRDIVTAAGFGTWFTHGTGHGVGLAIHEDPFVNASAIWVLQEGDVVTVEPGVYRGGFGGIRVEDLVEVTSSGGRTMTRSPKDTPCLPSAPTT